MLALSDPTQATVAAARSGSWFDVMTWKERRVPGRSDFVLIPTGSTVTIDRPGATARFVVTGNGTLTFSRTARSSLEVGDTLLNWGTLDIGSEQSPIPATASVAINFTGDGPFDPRRDPAQLSRGLISHGIFSMFGAAKTPYGRAADSSQVLRGAASVTLTEAPSGWSAGDTIAFGATVPGTRTERATITSIDGRTVSFSPALAYSHAAPELRAASSPKANNQYLIANTTRNVTLASTAALQKYRAHFMIGHRFPSNTDVAAFGFFAMNNIGRTSPFNEDPRVPAAFPVTDPQFDKNGAPLPLSLTNVRGRYAFHLHTIAEFNHSERPDQPHVVSTCGPSRDTVVRVTGAVVEGPVIYHYVVHGTSAELVNNISIGAQGSAFINEVGSEVGLYTGNLAMEVTGNPKVNADVTTRLIKGGPSLNITPGGGGVGFWSSSSGSMFGYGNTVYDARKGFVMWNEPLFEQYGTKQVSFPLENLLPHQLDTIAFTPGYIKTLKGGGSADVVSARDVPLGALSGNFVANAKQCLQIFGNRNVFMRDAASQDRWFNRENKVERLTCVNITGSGIGLNYTNGIDIEDAVVKAAPGNTNGVGLIQNLGVGQLTVHRGAFEGFGVGIDLPRCGPSNGVFGTRVAAFSAGVRINSPRPDCLGRNTLTGIVFTKPDGPKGADYALTMNRPSVPLLELQDGRKLPVTDLNRVFRQYVGASTYRVDSMDGHDFFLLSQHPQTRLIDIAGTYMRGVDEFAPLTNAELRRRFGLFLGTKMIVDPSQVEEVKGELRNSWGRHPNRAIGFRGRSADPVQVATRTIFTVESPHAVTVDQAHAYTLTVSYVEGGLKRSQSFEPVSLKSLGWNALPFRLGSEQTTAFIYVTTE